MAKSKTKKGFRAIDIVLFTFSAVFVLDSLGLSTTIGWSSILWWLILGVMFFLPYGMITAELSTTYSEGGIYQWVKNGIGFKNGARTNFCYWINVAFWMPSVYLILGSTFIYSIDPKILDNDWFVWVNVAIAITVTWITLFFNSINFEKVKWLPNAGAIIKGFLVIMMLVSMIIFLVDPNLFGAQNSFSGISETTSANSGYIATDINAKKGGIVPNFGTTLGIIGIIVYNLCGFELSQNVGESMEDVKKSIPKSLMIGGITILVSYLLASIPVFVTNNTVSDAYQNGAYQNSIITTLLSGLPSWLVIILAALLAFSLFTNMLTWSLGANGAMQEAAESKQFPAIFAKKNKANAPFSSALVLTIISNIAILLSGFMEYFIGGNAYFILFSFSLIIFFIPYIMIFIAYIKLRTIDKDVKRPFGIRKDWMAKVAGMICLVIVVIACITQVLTIDIASTITIKPVAELGGWGGFFATIAGVVIAMIVCDVMIYLRTRNKDNNSDNQANLIKPSANLSDNRKETQRINMIKNNQLIFNTYKKIKQNNLIKNNIFQNIMIKEKRYV